MFSLSQLIFIDSYSAGKTAIVCLKGNTNLNGGNGAGKTTMLRVLPLFFGAAPGQLVRQSGSNQSFVDYYLPRPTSYIVFEYEREGEKNLVIVYRRDHSLSICLLEGAYTDDLFFKQTDDSSNVVLSNEWVKTLKLRGLNPTQAMGVEDYKSIIQSGFRFTGSTDRKRKAFINENRLRFSYCHQGSSIENIDLIATAILEREPSIETIKEILTSILTHSNSVKSEIPQLSIKPAKLTAWINDRDAYQAMSDCDDDIKELNGLKFKVEESTQLQQAYRYHADTLLDKLNKEVKLLELEKAVAKDTLEAHEELTRVEKKSYLDEKYELESTLDAVSKKIITLETEKEAYKKQEIIEKKKLVQQIPALERDFTSSLNQYDELVKDQQDIESKFESLISKRKSLHQKTIIDLHNETTLAKETLQSKQEQLASDNANLLDSEESKKDKALEELQLRLKKNDKYGTIIETQLTHITAPRNLIENYEEISQQRDAFIDQTTAFDNDIQTSQNALNVHKREIEDVSKQADSKIAEKHNLENQLDHLKNLKNPLNNNLLSFLRSNHSSWTSTIAKVVPESLLLRSDLSPEITEEGQTLYGVSLDLSAVETSLAADEEQLQQKMLKIDSQLNEIEQSIFGLSTTSKKLSNQIKHFYADVFQAASKRKKHATQIEDCKKTLAAAQSEIDQAIKKKKETLQADLVIAKAKEEEEIVRINTLKLSYQSIKKEINYRYKEQSNGLNVEIRELQKEFEAKEQESKYKSDQDIDELEIQKNTALIDNGVDPDYLEKLTRSLKAQKNKLSSAKNSVEVVEKYQRWLDNNWSEFDTLKTQSRTANETLNVVIAAWEISKKDLQEINDDLKKKLTHIQNEYNKVEADANLLQRILEQLPDNGCSDSEGMTDNLLPNNPSLLETKWRSEIQNERKIADVAEAIYAKVCRDINTYRDSSPQKFLNRMTASISSEFTQRRHEWLYATEKLADYMRQDHQDHLKMLHATALTLGSQIDDYCTALNRIHKSINTLGSKVTRHTKEVITRFSAISNLTVNITSKLDKLNFWDALQQYSESYQAWKARSTALSALPDDTYIERLKLVSTLIENSGVSVQLANSFDISFSITDQGKKKVARTTKQLKDISSNGLAYLILIAIYTALVNMLRGGSNAVMVWPVDELRNFSTDNTVKLIALLEQHKIYLFSAFPDPDADLLKYYDNRYLIEEGRTLVEYPDETPDTANDINDLLMDGES